MDDFKIYNIQEIDILNEYSLGNTSNTNQSTNGVFNLETIDGVNELQLHQQENILIGYTSNSGVQYTDQGEVFLTSSNIEYFDFTTDITNPNILRLPGNARINKITVINIKGGPIPSQNPPDGFIGTTSIITYIYPNMQNGINIFGHITGETYIFIPLTIFNTLQTNTEKISRTITPEYIFFYGPNEVPPNTYQMQINIYYTLV